MNTPQRVHITHELKADAQTVFERLAEHENLGPLFSAKITRAGLIGTVLTSAITTGPPAAHQLTPPTNRKAICQ